MKNFFYSKIFVGIVCFSLGFLANHFFARSAVPMRALDQTTVADQYAINSDDFDHDKILEAMKSMQQNMMGAQANNLEITGVNRREDDHFVYYEIPLNDKEKNQGELKVNVKDGMISIAENTRNTQSERQFSIDPGLEDSKANVITEKDKILIKIPKKI